MNEYEITVLDNGIKVISCYMPRMESASVGIWVGAGSRYENKKVQGISHFIEHLLFKGTKKRSALRISREIEGAGGHINAYTAEEYTCYMARVRGRHVRLALDVLGDMVTSPLFREEDIERERLVVKEEMHMVIDNPSYYAGELVHGLLWPGHPLGRMILGTKDTIDSITRRDIFDFVNRNYSPKNMLVSAAGNIPCGRLAGYVRNAVKRRGNNNRPALRRFVPKQRSPRVKAVRRDTEQIHVCVALRALPREDPDRYALKLMNIVLGENMSSRLFQVIREKHGLSYDISSGVNYFRDTGSLVVSSGVKPGRFDRFNALVMREMRRLKKYGVTRAELKRAKEFYEGQFTVSLEKTMSRMLWLGETLTAIGRVPSVAEVLENMNKVKEDDIDRVSHRVLRPENLNIAVIGPVKENLKPEFGL